MLTAAQLALLLFIFTLGSGVQAIAGMGFGLISVPLMTLMFGPENGVLIGNIGGFANAVVMMIVRRRDVEWKTVGWMMIGAVPGTALMIYLLHDLHSNWLSLLVGVVMLGMVTFSILALRFPPIDDAPIHKLITGFMASLLSVTVAQSAPVMVTYAQARRWSQAAMAATLQPFFAGMNLIVLPGKLATGMGDLLVVSPPVLGVLAAGIFLGITLGRLGSRWFTAQAGRRLAITVAAVGALVICVRSVMALSA